MAQASAGSVVMDLREDNAAQVKDLKIDLCLLEMDTDHPIGSGGCGKVYKGNHKYWGSVAFKRLSTDFTPKGRNKLLAELKFLKDLRHPKIVQVIGYVWEKDSFGLLLPYYKYGSLDSFLDEYGPVSQPTKLDFLHQICLGMNYLHTHRPTIVHRDLKINNILVDNALEVKLTDFGISEWRTTEIRQTKQSMKDESKGGTSTHVPPEMWKNINLIPKQPYDVYSYGIVMWEVFTEQEPYNSQSIDIIRMSVLDGQRPSLEVMQAHCQFEELVQLMQFCWQDDLHARPTFQNIKENLDVCCERYKAQIDDEERRMKARIHAPAGQSSVGYTPDSGIGSTRQNPVVERQEARGVTQQDPLSIPFGAHISGRSPLNTASGQPPQSMFPSPSQPAPSNRSPARPSTSPFHPSTQPSVSPAQPSSIATTPRQREFSDGVRMMVTNSVKSPVDQFQPGLEARRTSFDTPLKQIDDSGIQAQSAAPSNTFPKQMETSVGTAPQSQLEHSHTTPRLEAFTDTAHHGLEMDGQYHETPLKGVAAPSSWQQQQQQRHQQQQPQHQQHQQPLLASISPSQATSPSLPVQRVATDGLNLPSNLNLGTNAEAPTGNQSLPVEQKSGQSNVDAMGRSRSEQYPASMIDVPAGTTNPRLPFARETRTLENVHRTRQDQGQRPQGQGSFVQQDLIASISPLTEDANLQSPTQRNTMDDVEQSMQRRQREMSAGNANIAAGNAGGAAGNNQKGGLMSIVKESSLEVDALPENNLNQPRGRGGNPPRSNPPQHAAPRGATVTTIDGSGVTIRGNGVNINMPANIGGAPGAYNSGAMSIPSSAVMSNAISNLQVSDVGGDRVRMRTTPDGGMQIGTGNTMNINLAGLTNNQRKTVAKATASKKKQKRQIVVTESLEVICDQNIQDMAVALGRKWREVARALGFTDAELETFEYDNHQYGLREIITQMLRKWREMKGIDATLKELADRLIDLKMFKQAEQLKEYPV